MRRASHRYHGEPPPVAPVSDHIQCSGKKQYRAFKDASRVAGLVRMHKDGTRLQPYRCHFCQHYHIGQGSGMPTGRPRKIPENV